MQFLSPAQCRAARGLLDWSQPDLAQKCGMHVQTICAFEKEMSTPTKTTLEKITKAFEDFGIEFVGKEGVTKKQNIIRKYEGTNLGKKFLDEIYYDMKDTGGEILLKGVVENKWYDTPEDTVFLENHIQRLINANITEKILISDKDNTIVAPKSWYRKMPKKYFSFYTQWIYKNKVAMMSWGKTEKLIIIESPELFEAETKTFYCLWDKVAKKI